MATIEEKIKAFLAIGDGDGSGYGYGDGDGYGSGDGSGYGYGINIKSFNGKQVHIIDNVQTIIESVHSSYARGYVLNSDLTLTSCFIAKVSDYFAHGATLKQAVQDAAAKYEKNKPITERIADFKRQYPTLDSIAKGADLYQWHNTLTGSCRLGREQFCRDHNIDPDKVTITVRKFLVLTENAYGKDIIKQVKEAYQLCSVIFNRMNKNY